MGLALTVATAELSLPRHFHLCNAIPEVDLGFRASSEKKSRD